MDSLKIPLSSITEHGVPFRATVSVASLQPDGAEPLLIKEVTVSGTFTLIDGEVLAEGQITGTFAHPCDRCLEPASHTADIAFMWFFSEGGVESAPPIWDGEEVVEVDLDEDELPRAIIDGEIDLGRSVWEELVLAAPAKFLCSESCRGLCPTCGANLNLAACACEAGAGNDPGGETEQKKGFAKLADLFPDLLRKPAED